MSIVTEMVQQAAISLTAQLDAGLRSQISAYLGTDKWQPEEIAHRLTKIIRLDDPDETFAIDGVPLLIIGPVTSEYIDNRTIIFDRTVKICPLPSPEGGER